MDEPLQLGDSIIVRPGEQFAQLNLDMSGWRGRVVEIDEDGNLLIAWDSQTLREMPETAVIQWLADDTDWSCMFVESEAVLPYEPRDTIVDSLAAARQRTAAYGHDFDLIANNPLYEDFIDEDWDDDEEWDEEWEPVLPPYFDLDQFLYSLEIPIKEHPRIRRALSQGLGQYFYDNYGYYKHGKQPADLIPETMGVPFIFGYGVLAILDHKQIAQATKLKICEYTLSIIDPVYDNAVPYGLVTIAGYLAASGSLSIPIFQFIMIALEYGGIGPFRRSLWQFGVQREAVLHLLDWLAVQADILADEKLFWVWRWSMHCEHDPHLVKALANTWLAHPDVTVEAKQQLCWAWLQESEQVGTPPQTFQLMSAFTSGDRDQIKQIIAEVGILNLPLDELMAAMPPGVADDESGLMFQFLYGSRDLWLVPAPLKRIAIPMLARLGEDPQTVAEMFWEQDGEYYTDAVQGGIADLLREFREQIPPDALRGLVERGLHHGRVTVRKTYHILARDLYGEEYLPLAQEDAAKSLRTWAEKQIDKKKK